MRGVVVTSVVVVVAVVVGALAEPSPMEPTLRFKSKRQAPNQPSFNHPSHTHNRPTFAPSHSSNQPTTFNHNTNQPTTFSHNTNQPTTFSHNTNQPTTFNHNHTPSQPAQPAGVSKLGPGPLELPKFLQEFALDIADMSRAERGNVVFSPLGISSVLSMLLLATSGQTKHELRTVLQYPHHLLDLDIHQSFGKMLRRLLEERTDLIMSIANRLYLQKDAEILTKFTTDAREHYGARAVNVDFKQTGRAETEINQWVSQETHGKINNIISGLSPLTTMVSVNTVYFNGLWETPFPEAHTKNGTFNTGTKTFPIPMMRSLLEVPYLNLPGLNAEMIALPYKGGVFAMIFLMPKGNASIEALNELELSLDADMLSHHVGAMQLTFMNVVVPRMRLTYKTDLAGVLRRLGVNALFNATAADLSGMTPTPVHVDKVAHETVIDITESGTEAAAATATQLNRIGSSRVFIVNRPALMIIREMKTGVPVFYGRIEDPTPIYDDIDDNETS